MGIESTEKVLESGNQDLNTGQNDLAVNDWGPKVQRSRTWSNFCLSHFDISCKPFACTLWWSKVWHFLEQSHTVGYQLLWMTLSRLQSPANTNAGHVVCGTEKWMSLWNTKHMGIWHKTRLISYKYAYPRHWILWWIIILQKEMLYFTEKHLANQKPVLIH